jgi:hypothetical protein
MRFFLLSLLDIVVVLLLVVALCRTIFLDHLLRRSASLIVWHFRVRYTGQGPTYVM